MATDLERLVVSLEANIKKYEREMARARGVTEKSLRDVETSVSASTARVESSMGRMGASIRTGLASALAGLSIGSLTKFADANTRIENSLKVSGLAGDDLSKTYETLFQAAQRQGIPFEALATLYGRAALAQKELGVSSAELTRFTEGVAVALRVAGQSSEQASGALLQLGQLLASGKVQAEEFNSVQEGALPVLQAVAAGLKEAGGSVAKLKELVKDGEVSSQAFFRAFEAGRPILDGMAANSAPKLSDGITRIENALTMLIGEMDKLSGASKAVASAIDTMVKSFEVPDVFRNTLHELELLVKGYGAPIYGFDDVLALLSDMCRSVFEERSVAVGQEAHFSMLVGGLSLARDRWETYRIGTRAFPYLQDNPSLKPEDQRPPFEPVPLPPRYFAPNPYPEDWLAARQDPSRVDDADPVDLAARAICAARVRMYAVPSDPERSAYTVGGFLQVSVLTEGGVTSNIVHRWPDRLGIPIELRGELLPAFLRNLSVDT